MGRPKHPAGREEGRVRARRPRVRRSRQESGPTGPWSIAFSPDGSLVASGNLDRVVTVWEVATGKLRYTLAGHGWDVRCVAFSPDGSILASSSKDTTVKLWDAATGELRDTLQGHTGDVWGLAFSPDGATLASAGFDNTVILWDVASGELQGTLTGHTGGIWSLAFSPDGSLLASASEDLTIRLWGTDPTGRRPSTRPAEPASPDRRSSGGRLVTRRIDFRRPDSIQQFVLNRPEEIGWDAKEEAMVIAGEGGRQATYAEYFRSISSVTIRGMIVPPSKYNFRIGIGTIKLIFNWEGRDRNRFHVGKKIITETKPRALTPGTTHEVRIAQEGEQVVISLDGEHHHTMTARLEGTVSVYTVYGTTIKISEIEIEGVADPAVPVTGPTHKLY
ncbi:MAG: WD40 repeat domain-containing protein [Planctomycetota bacterium]